MQLYGNNEQIKSYTKSRPATSSVCKGSWINTTYDFKSKPRVDFQQRLNLKSSIRLIQSHKSRRNASINFTLQGVAKVLQHPYENIERRLQGLEDLDIESEQERKWKVSLNLTQNQNLFGDVNSWFVTKQHGEELIK